MKEVDCIPGRLLEIRFRAIFLEACQEKWNYVNLDCGYLLCLDSMDMTGEWAAAAAAAAAVPAAWAAWAAPAPLAPREEYDKIYALAKEEYEKTGRIKGYKFLSPDGKNNVWLSRYDIKFLEKNKS